MLYYKTDQKMYYTRKDLKNKIGEQTYQKEFKAGNIMFINDNEFLDSIKK